jgi:membrane-associated phospholipid phosphatase
VGIIWWLLTAFSRITVGAHYLTDVSVGGIIIMFSYLIVWGISIYVNKKIRKLNKKS